MNHVRSFICCLISAIIIGIPLIPAIARDGSRLEVTGTVVLSRESSPYTFESVTVQKTGTLVIDPGVELRITEGGIEVAGLVKALGTESKPILITASPGKEWQGFHVSRGAPPAQLRYVIFKDFTNPLYFQNVQTTLDHIDLVDGTCNDIVFDAPGPLPVFRGSYLRSVNRRKGSEMSEARIIFAQAVDNIWLEHVSFESGGSFKDQRWQSYGVNVQSPYGNLHLIDIVFPYRCTGIFSRLVPQKEAYFVPSEACVEPLIPTLFVPGYGSSMNLSVLTKAPGAAVPSLVGWRFLPFLSASYLDLERGYSQSGIPYGIAYYDWRLPAAQAAERYLKPAIEKLKHTYNVTAVNIVAHSFGGIVARSYIEGGGYGGDVASLVELGTPNKGAPKAYSAWEGGVLPDDWSAAFMLIRFYQYKFKRMKDRTVSVLRDFFPSAREMLPIYPALFRAGTAVNPRTVKYPNNTLLELSDYRLSRLVSLISFSSISELTLDRIEVGQSDKRLTEWPDGSVEAYRINSVGSGDGTVPGISAELAFGTNMRTSGSHASLTSAASRSVIERLYPTIPYRGGDPLVLSTWTHGFHTLAFDCPVSAVVTLPDGSSRDSADPDTATSVGSVEQSDELLWIAVPAQSGTYRVAVKGLADTPVRMWIDRGEIQEFTLKKNEVSVFTVSLSDHSDPIEPTPPSAVPIPRAPEARQDTAYTGDGGTASLIQNIDLTTEVPAETQNNSLAVPPSSPIFAMLRADLSRISLVVPNTVTQAIPVATPQRRAATGPPPAPSGSRPRWLILRIVSACIAILAVLILCLVRGSRR